MANAFSTIAQHPNLKAIQSKLLAGVSLRRIAAEYNCSYQALGRYKRNVLAKAILQGVNSVPANTSPHDLSPVKEIQSNVNTMIAAVSTASLLARKLERYGPILDMAAAKGDAGAWASVDRAETAALQLRADLLGERAQAQAPNVQIAILIPRLPPNSDDGDGGGEVIDVAAQ